jgi:hypothetical protein
MKIINVDSCWHCPFDYGTDYQLWEWTHFCKHKNSPEENEITTYNTGVVPGWCPLKKDKQHVIHKVINWKGDKP